MEISNRQLLAFLATCECCKNSLLPNPIPPLTLLILGLTPVPFRGVFIKKIATATQNHCGGILLDGSRQGRVISCQLGASPLSVDLEGTAESIPTLLGHLPPLIAIVDVPTPLQCVVPWLEHVASLAAPENQKKYCARYVGVGLSCIVWINENMRLLEGFMTSGEPVESSALVVSRYEFEPPNNRPTTAEPLYSITDCTFLHPSLHAFVVCHGSGKGLAVFDFFSRTELFRVPSPDGRICTVRCCTLPRTESAHLLVTASTVVLGLTLDMVNKRPRWSRVALKEPSNGHYGVAILGNSQNRTLCAISCQRSGVLVVDYVTGQRIAKLDVTNALTSLYIPHSEQLLVLGSGGFHIFE